MTLKYPLELTESVVDYVIFSAEEYRSNRNFAGQQNAGGAGGPRVGEDIILYMPNSTPPVNNSQSYGPQNFTGPLGVAMAEMGISIAAGVDNATRGNFDTGAAIDNIKRQFENVKSNLPAIGGQFATQAVAGLFGTSTNALTALQRGQIYNPNIELIYESPTLRGFSMDFVFAPKSADETRAVNNIIKEFKRWSTPAVDGFMLEVPCVWNVKYMTNGAENMNMNLFKKAVLSNIVVQANPSSDMHNSFSDGMPIITSMSLGFQEVDIITREDHDQGGNQGF